VRPRGGGIGYAVGHNTKDAVIGGLGGALIATWQGNGRIKAKRLNMIKTIKTGYNQAPSWMWLLKIGMRNRQRYRLQEKLYSITLLNVKRTGSFSMNRKLHWRKSNEEKSLY